MLRYGNGHLTGSKNPGLPAGWQAEAYPPLVSVFHEISRAEGPGQQKTKDDLPSHLASRLRLAATQPVLDNLLTRNGLTASRAGRYTCIISIVRTCRSRRVRHCLPACVGSRSLCCPAPSA